MELKLNPAIAEDYRLFLAAKALPMSRVVGTAWA